ncbi:hypothetical protein BDV28DRAFT_137602 [Aspergillus coremiiformis]|uniref:Cytochrome c oxidase assembly factor 3 n=1 Tax=Aspergillus coremiiformis TaxID=138285 RepID=A0A5N6Z0N6_9EURO|nr:hypothetical protein BDV28DRAFT_137602 [Aspergillus coremiiformis]
MAPGIFNSTYYNRNGRAGAALLRARRPFLIKNTLSAIALTTLTLSIYAYTIHVIGQDEFSDVKVPDTPAKPQQKQ